MRIAFVFPGQGSQSVGMLSGFAGNETVAGVMARADEALGFSLTGLIAEGPAETRGFFLCILLKKQAFSLYNRGYYGVNNSCDFNNLNNLTQRKTT